MNYAQTTDPLLVQHAPLDSVPHFSVSWDTDAREDPLDRLAVHSSYRPEPVIRDTPTDTVCLLGHTIIGDRIDKAGAIDAFLEAGDRGAFLRSLNGEFLLLHLDKSRHALTVANDRFASIPFYYAALNQRFVGSVFYADLWRQLRAAGPVPVRQEAVFEFIALQRVLGTKTYDTISSFLPAASTLTVEGRRQTIARYWRPDFTKNQSWSISRWSDELAARLRRSLARKTSDGARIGLFLSGGMDTRTVLAAASPAPVCFTVGFGETYEVKVAREAARLAKAPHRYLELPTDYYSRHLDELIALSGGMYVYDHALFLGLRASVAPHADVILHGHGLDYLFQGMYLPTRRAKILSHTTFLRWLRPLGDDVAAEYLSTINFRLKTVDPMRYVRPEYRTRLSQALVAAVR